MEKRCLITIHSGQGIAMDLFKVGRFCCVALQEGYQPSVHLTKRFSLANFWPQLFDCYTQYHTRYEMALTEGYVTDVEELVHDQIRFFYQHLKSELKEAIASFELSETVGIHFRGTDRARNKKKKCEKIERAKEIIRESPSCLLCTDDKEVWKELKAPNVVPLWRLRSSGNLGIHKGKQFNQVTAAKEALIDIGLLSKCKQVYANVLHSAIPSVVTVLSGVKPTQI